MRDHAVGWAQPVRDGLPVAHQQFLHLQIGETMLLQAAQQVADLNGGRQQAAKEAASLQRLTRRGQMLPRLTHV